MLRCALGRRLLLVALAVLVLAGLGSAADDDGKRPLLWGADEEGGAPYIYKEDGEYVGFEVDIARALERKLGRKVEFKQYPFKELVKGLQRGDIDFAMNGLEVTKDRAAQVRFSRPYYFYRLQLVTRKGDERLKSVKDLEGNSKLKVGTLENTAAARLLERLGVTLKTYDDQVNPYKDLAQKQLDAVLLDLPIALYVVQKNDELNKVLQFTGPPVEPGQYAIAFRKDNEALAKEVDAALGRVIRSGELERILKGWDLWNDDQQSLQGEQHEVGGEASGPGDFREYLALLGSGALLTVCLSVVSMALAMLLGLIIALVRLYGPAPLRGLAIVYVEFFRGIPVLFLLYFLYFGLPELGQHYQLSWSLKMSPLTAAVVGFAINYAAYESEIYRAGIASIPAGQWEAAASLGMGPALTFRRIILPQALRVILPPTTNDFVALFKETSVASVIVVAELMKQYQFLVNNPKNYPNYLEIAGLTALLYLVMSVPLGHLSRYLEKRWEAAA